MSVKSAGMSAVSTSLSNGEMTVMRLCLSVQVAANGIG